MSTNRWLWLAAAAVLAGGCSGNDDGQQSGGGGSSDGCDPKCGYGYVCDEGECKPRSEVCKPKCDEEYQVCEGGKCVYKDPYCTPNTCSEDKSAYCPTEEEADGRPVWVACDPYSTCKKSSKKGAYCAFKTGYDCHVGECNDAHTACNDGKAIKCNDDYEECQEGKCVVASGKTCAPHTCLTGGQNSEQYYCTDEGYVAKCDSAERCQNGDCLPAAVSLWTLCSSDHDCNPGYSCVRNLTMATDLGNTSEMVPLSTIDKRIAATTGICSKDCSLDPSVCEGIFPTIDFTCQMIHVGSSPWPSNPVYPLWSGAENIEAGMAAVEADTPTGAVCRPNLSSVSELCKPCDGKCDQGYACVDGMCLLPCENDDNCPLFFSCADESSLPYKVCKPKAGICGSCLDPDNDGYGLGRCENPGYDCDEDNTEIHWSVEMPALCEANVDRNCNGLYDDVDLIGTDDHCKACGDRCDPTMQMCKKSEMGNECVFVGSYCKPGTCSEDKTQYCELEDGTTETVATWKKCAIYEECVVVEGEFAPKSECQLKEGFECSANECVQIPGANAACVDGKPVPCVDVYEVCLANECVPNQALTCLPNTCFAESSLVPAKDTEKFYCSAEGIPARCPEGERCQAGSCVRKIEDEDVSIWKMCTQDSQCLYGRCLKEVSIIHGSGTIALSSLDSRLMEGTGICTYDCGLDPQVCDRMTEGDFDAWSCQTVYEGASPWMAPTESVDWLPQAGEVDMDAVRAGVPFAAVCRPNIDLDTGWSGSFCAVCSSNADCEDGYPCVDGQCLAPCEKSQHCPYLFSCEEVAGLNTKVCKPKAGRCSDCYDPDGDGSGIGNCPLAGTDCKPQDASTFYSDALPLVCESGKNRNCNMSYDDAELLGTVDHCTACNEACATDDGRDGELSKERLDNEHIDYACVQRQCEYKCEDGFAECTGRVLDGCTQLVKIEPSAYKPISGKQTATVCPSGCLNGQCTNACSGNIDNTCSGNTLTYCDEDDDGNKAFKTDNCADYNMVCDTNGEFFDCLEPCEDAELGTTKTICNDIFALFGYIYVSYTYECKDNGQGKKYWVGTDYEICPDTCKEDGSACEEVTACDPEDASNEQCNGDVMAYCAESANLAVEDGYVIRNIDCAQRDSKCKIVEGLSGCFSDEDVCTTAGDDKSVCEYEDGYYSVMSDYVCGETADHELYWYVEDYDYCEDGYGICTPDRLQCIEAATCKASTYVEKCDGNVVLYCDSDLETPMDCDAFGAYCKVFNIDGAPYSDCLEAKDACTTLNEKKDECSNIPDYGFYTLHYSCLETTDGSEMFFVQTEEPDACENGCNDAGTACK